jgi:alkylhydroperoxidase family enzyme
MSTDVLGPLPVDQWGDEEYAAFGKLLGMPADKVPRAGSGHAYDPLNFDIIGLLVRHPKLANVFLSYNGFLLQRGELPGRIRELVILRVAHRDRSAYEWGQHVKMAAANGVGADEISAVAAGNEGFTGPDLIALEAADELLENGHLAWPSWQRLSTELGERPAIELIFLVGTYAMSAMAFRTWGLAPAPGMTPLPQPRKDH